MYVFVCFSLVFVCLFCIIFFEYLWNDLHNKINKCMQYTRSPEKRNQHVFFVISPIKLQRFLRNLVHRFLNKFAAK